MTIILKKRDSEGAWLTATFLPQQGMAFSSFKRGDIEVIDQTTKPLFEQRFAGLGPLIGPHFHHRNPKVIPKIQDPSHFPHLAHVTGDEPFSHGVARYAPWSVSEESEEHIVAHLNGEMTLGGATLKELEGQNFKMRYEVRLVEEGLSIQLSVVSDSDSLVGLHTYYALPQGEGQIRARVKNLYNDKVSFKPLKEQWPYTAENEVTLVLEEAYDYGFFPFPDPLKAKIELITPSHTVGVSYESPNEENSWQLWHPKGAPFVCIEPLSAKDPERPHLAASSINILISIR